MTKIKLLDETFREVKLPYFCTDGVCYVYKIYSEDHCLAVCTTSSNLGIAVCFSGLPFSTTGDISEITEKGFNAAVLKVTKKLLAL
jgi:3-methyladenine DNA glycosylase Mpg